MAAVAVVGEERRTAADEVVLTATFWAARSTADAILQMEYPATLNHDIGIVEKVLPIDRAEIAPA